MSYQLKRGRIKSLKDIAYESIKEAILSGQLKPGEQLTESEISRQLDISRGPIREAFHQLAMEGLVYSEPYRRTVVAEFSQDEANQVYFPIRQQIERYACIQASTLFSEKDYMFLEECIAEMEVDCREQNIESISRKDADFHRYIVSRCTSGTLSSIWESLAAHFYGKIFFHNRLKWDRPEFSYIPEEHRELLAAIQANDAVLIDSLIHAHIHSTYISEESYSERNDGKC